MKRKLQFVSKKAALLIVVLLCFGLQNLFAQDTDFKKNNVQINLSSLVLNNYSFNYERSIARKITLSAGYKFMPRTKIGDISLINSITNKLVDDESDIADLKDTYTSNQTVTAEVRFYAGKHAGPRGFYVSLYGRYSSMKIDYPYVYEGNSGDINLPLKTTLNGLGGGVMVGAKWLFCKRVSLDVYILGLHYGNISGDVNGVGDLSNESADNKASLKEDIDSKFKLLGKNYIKSSTVNDSGLQAHASGPFAGIRGLGINLGISF